MSNNKRAMISQPMNGLTDAEIMDAKNRFLDYANRNDLEVVNTLFTDEWYSSEEMKSRSVVHIPLQFIAKSIEAMSTCNVVYFSTGWSMARGCVIEHNIAVAYGLEIVYE